jgi:peptidoglycan/LPS O-acetylase OafA/YrhL
LLPVLKLQYRADIDGMRAIAVLAVVLFHAFPKFLPGGYVGVDVFFVISGFLITSIIVQDLDRSRFSFARFYAARARRIFPALAVILIATLIAGAIMLVPAQLASLAKNALASSLFGANFTLLSEAGYFDLDAQFKPLLHLWSLGIEEQFYLVWPLAIWFAARQWRTAAIIAVMLGYSRSTLPWCSRIRMLPSTCRSRAPGS